MRLSTKKHDKYVIVKVEEKNLNSIIAPQLKSEFLILNTEGRSTILVDLGPVEYADSSGLSALLRANSMCQENGGLLVLFNLTPHVEKLVKISQLDRVLTLLPTQQEAIEAAFLHEIEKDITEEDELDPEISSEFDSLERDDAGADEG